MQCLINKCYKKEKLPNKTKSLKMDKITASLMEKKPYNQEGLAEGRTSLVFSVRGPIPIQVNLFQMSVSFLNLDFLYDLLHKVHKKKPIPLKQFSVESVQICVKFKYSEKVTKFCEIFTLLLTGTTY